MWAPERRDDRVWPWGRGTGEGIGLSGHKNEYKTGVRVGNWVEEQFSAEATKNAYDMEKFLKATEDAHFAKAKAQQAESNKRIEPNMGVSNAMLFSHGPQMGLSFSAPMASLHYTDPAARGAWTAGRGGVPHAPPVVLPRVAPHSAAP